MMDFFRTKSKMHLSTWDEKKLIMLELSPALEAAGKGQPAAGEIRYNKDLRCTISFTAEDAFKFAYCIDKIINGGDITYKKMADTTKVAAIEGGEIKELTATKSNKGGIFINLKSGEKNVTIILASEEGYAVQKFMETKAAGYC